MRLSSRPRFSLSVCLLFVTFPPALAQDGTVDLLRRIADAPGPSGFEEPIRKVMVTAMRPYANSLRFDGMGSIIATQARKGRALWWTPTWMN